ncbi:phosphoglycerate mutase family protein [Ostertagia ostertagi]
MEHFRFDPPLTQFGYSVAERIFSSPELRCVQTAAAIARTLKIPSVSICIEPALADWKQLIPDGSSNHWLTTDQLRNLGYPIDEGYNPILDELPSTESPQEYRQRLDNFFLEIAESSENVLVIVSNAPTLAVAMKRPWSTAKQLGDVPKDRPKVLPFTRSPSSKNFVELNL